jgi:hypothetical protein
MLRYINWELCEAIAARGGSGSSASFYYILRICGGAMRAPWCNAPKSP